MPPLLRSRMLTPAFRFFGALATLGLVGALLQAFTSDQPFIDAVLGPLTLGWKGGVGNHLAYTVLVSLFVLAATLGGLFLAFRDADPEAEAEVLHTESVPLTRAPHGTNFLPLVATFGIGILVIGLVTNIYVILAGAAVLVMVLFVWALRAWAERATGDPEVNAEIYSRFIEPVRVPILSFLIVGGLAIAVSRVLLAVSETGAVAVFGVLGAAFLLGAVLVAARPQITKNAVTVILFIVAVLVIAAGIGAAVVGQREIEHHGDDHGAESTSADAGADEGAGAGEGTSAEHGLGVVVDASAVEGEA